MMEASVRSTSSSSSVPRNVVGIAGAGAFCTGVGMFRRAAAGDAMAAPFEASVAAGAIVAAGAGVAMGAGVAAGACLAAGVV